MPRAQNNPDTATPADPQRRNTPTTPSPAAKPTPDSAAPTGDVKVSDAPTVEQLQRALDAERARAEQLTRELAAAVEHHGRTTTTLDEERTQREHIAQELVEERTRREHIEREHERLRDEFRARWDERERAFDAERRAATSTATTARPPKPRKRIATASFRVTHRGNELEVRAHDELPADLEVGELPSWAWREE